MTFLLAPPTGIVGFLFLALFFLELAFDLMGEVPLYVIAIAVAVAVVIVLAEWSVSGDFVVAANFGTSENSFDFFLVESYIMLVLLWIIVCVLPSSSF